MSGPCPANREPDAIPWSMTTPTLHTARLVLTRVTPADRADLVALEADPEVMRFLNGGQPVPEAGWPDADFLTPRGTEPEVMAARLRATGEFVGWFALFDDGDLCGARTAEVGYRLRRACWGQGYATEGVQALLVEAFERQAFDTVRAQTMATNLGSRRVLEKLGFAHVDTVFPDSLAHLAGGELGEVVYEIGRREGPHGRRLPTLTPRPSPSAARQRAPPPERHALPLTCGRCIPRPPPPRRAQRSPPQRRPSPRRTGSAAPGRCLRCFCAWV